MLALKNNKSLWLKLFILPIILMMVLFLGGCSTTEKASYMGVDEELTYSCKYYESTDETMIMWESYIKNSSIYNMKEYTVVFDIYQDETVVYENKTLSYSKTIRHGSTSDLNNYFYVSGEVNKIEFVMWHADFDNIWNSYKAWWIVAISITAVALVLSIVFAVIDLDIDIDSFAWVLWGLPGLVAVFAGISIPELIGLNWVIFLIMFGGLAISSAIALITYAIKQSL